MYRHIFLLIIFFINSSVLFSQPFENIDDIKKLLIDNKAWFVNGLEYKDSISINDECTEGEILIFCPEKMSIIRCNDGTWLKETYNWTMEMESDSIDFVINYDQNNFLIRILEDNTSSSGFGMRFDLILRGVGYSPNIYLNFKNYLNENVNSCD